MHELNNIKAVGKVVSVFLLIGAVLALPSLFDEKETSFYLKLLLGYQLFLSVSYLIVSIFLNKEERLTIWAFQTVNLLGIIYGLVFPIAFAYKQYEALSNTAMFPISVIFLVIVIGGPFMWCQIKIQKYKR